MHIPQIWHLQISNNCSSTCNTPYPQAIHQNIHSVTTSLQKQPFDLKQKSHVSVWEATQGPTQDLN